MCAFDVSVVLTTSSDDGVSEPSESPIYSTPERPTTSSEALSSAPSSSSTRRFVGPSPTNSSAITVSFESSASVAPSSTSLSPAISSSGKGRPQPGSQRRLRTILIAVVTSACCVTSAAIALTYYTLSRARRPDPRPQAQLGDNTFVRSRETRGAVIPFVTHARNTECVHLEDTNPGGRVSSKRVNEPPPYEP